MLVRLYGISCLQIFIFLQRRHTHNALLTLSVRHSLRNIEVIAEDSQDMGSLVGRPHALIARFLKARRVLDTAHIVILVSYTVYWCVRPSLGPSTPLKNT